MDNRNDNVDPTTDGVLYVRSSTSSYASDSVARDYVVSYDFRPIFPPYDRHRYHEGYDATTTTTREEGAAVASPPTATTTNTSASSHVDGGQ
jgi:hypothetical protein